MGQMIMIHNTKCNKYKNNNTELNTENEPKKAVSALEVCRIDKNESTLTRDIVWLS